MARFELSKWYADCVTERAEAAILYQAELRWGAVHLHYSSLLMKVAETPARSDYSLQRQTSPALEDGELNWESTKWKVRGVWTGLGEGQRKTLYASGSSLLDWNCIAPRAKVSLQIGNAPPLQGWGYAEHLRLTVAPWKLPIKRLRWGRFVNATDTVVWIDWSGTFVRRDVFWNGRSVDAREIGDTEIVFEDGWVMSLDRGAVLRDGILGATALAVIPNLNRLFPDSILNMRECKWLSRAVLRRAGMPDSVGMAIHEVVEWP